MNLVDLLDEDGLKQDEWSLTAPTFGKEGQLTVVGWSGKSYGTKYYILKCNKCSEDTELFGDGHFKSLRGHLSTGAIPCNCARSYRWSKCQYEILCLRKADELGYKFLGFLGWLGRVTKLHLSCPEHGKWTSGIIKDFVNRGVGCPECNGGTRKADEVMIASFFASEAFDPATKFWRSGRNNTQGKRTHWNVECPVCGEQAEAYCGSLQKGHRPCACSPMRQQECYINWVIDDTGVTKAIKFGIANDSNRRIKNQNKKSVHEIVQRTVYIFSTVESCKAAERECKSTLVTGVVPKQEMSDGYTETTYVSNLDKIKQIYIKHGGVEVWPSL